MIDAYGNIKCCKRDKEKRIDGERESNGNIRQIARGEYQSVLSSLRDRVGSEGILQICNAICICGIYRF